jgi:hypothetical protein
MIQAEHVCLGQTTHEGFVDTLETTLGMPSSLPRHTSRRERCVSSYAHRPQAGAQAPHKKLAFSFPTSEHVTTGADRPLQTLHVANMWSK